MNKYNTTGARIAAAIVDGIIFLPVGLLNGILTEELAGATVPLIIWTIIFLSLFQVYSIFMHGKYGQTFGKRAMGVKIVSFLDELPISYMQATMRDLPYIILLIADIVVNIAFTLHPEYIFNSSMVLVTEIFSYAGTVWILVEIISMLANDKKRAIHDLIAKTVVIKINRDQPAKTTGI